jgi:hypothetical protein
MISEVSNFNMTVYNEVQIQLVTCHLNNEYYGDLEVKQAKTKEKDDSNRKYVYSNVI